MTETLRLWHRLKSYISAKVKKPLTLFSEQLTEKCHCERKPARKREIFYFFAPNFSKLEFICCDLR